MNNYDGKLKKQAREISYFATDQMNKIAQKLSGDDKDRWKNVISRFADQNRSVLFSLNISFSMSSIPLEFFLLPFVISPMLMVINFGVKMNMKVFHE